MANHPIHHDPHGNYASFTTPTALMLDTRLTPLERNGWQVLRMLRAADGTSPLANKRVLAGEFRLWAGRRQAQSANPPQQAMPRSVGSTQPEQPWQQAVSKPASPEAACFHIALAREILKKPVNAGDLAAHVMRSKGWRPGPA